MQGTACEFRAGRGNRGGKELKGIMSTSGEAVTEGVTKVPRRACSYPRLAGHAQVGAPMEFMTRCRSGGGDQGLSPCPLPFPVLGQLTSTPTDAHGLTLKSVTTWPHMAKETLQLG